MNLILKMVKYMYIYTSAVEYNSTCRSSLCFLMDVNISQCSGISRIHLLHRKANETMKVTITSCIKRRVGRIVRSRKSISTWYFRFLMDYTLFTRWDISQSLTIIQILLHRLKNISIFSPSPSPSPIECARERAKKSEKSKGTTTSIREGTQMPTSIARSSKTRRARRAKTVPLPSSERASICPPL